MAWTQGDIADLTGRGALVTGANVGLGYETALGLAKAGAEVVLATRNHDKGLAAVEAILKERPGALARVETLDLASLKSVADLAERLADRQPSLDILVNNAGMISGAARETTEDGFERQFGVNYLGHFALTGRLLPMLRASSAPRVVSLSSMAHRMGRIDFSDLQQQRRPYARLRAYSQSKLAMLMFARELQRRSDAGGWGLTSVAAHPGYARTTFMSRHRTGSALAAGLGAAIERRVSQSAAEGAAPVLLAATAAEADRGGYYGPDGFMELKGAPKPARVSRRAQDLSQAARLWTVSEELTGVRYG